MIAREAPGLQLSDPRSGLAILDEPSVPAIRAAGIRHVYRARNGPVTALEQADFAVERGEFLALLGPSGCGKSTLLRILAGLMTPTAGVVELSGEAPTTARTRLGLGWLAQDDGLLPWMTVAENVALPLRLGGKPRTTPEPVAAALASVGLAEAERLYPHELSGGMRQRAALARALIARPAYLFLDEPFANLDELTRDRLGHLLLEVRLATRPTTVLVTHSIAEAVRLADRVLVLSQRPSHVALDQPLTLPRPRRYDQPGFGEIVQSLRGVLALDGGQR